ncbi:DUF1129 domain-containing protein [Lactobacillus agrestimuris]|uniref:DUF1129 domain-containing protein n=1 Tax=Lactobacillus agrestimuris TaxID=2941328 RepID=UPI00204410FD|nr:DUF1129 family protein [Lactobacillus agrestimuris]
MAEEKKENTAKINENKQAKLKAKAENAEKEEAVKSQSSEELRKSLSNKNSDYVFRLQKELEKQGNLSSEDAKAKVDALLPEMVTAQRRGVTANNLFAASPSIKADQLLHPVQKPKTIMDMPFWQRAVDSILLMLAIFMGMYGLLSAFSNQKQIQDQSGYGVTSIIIISVVMGLFMIKFNELLMPNPKTNKRPKLLKGILISAGFIIIVVALTALLALPALKVLNPVLPGIVYLIIAAISFGVRYLFRKQYHIVGSTFAPNPNPRRK